jgi:hypothetical protein
MNKAFSGDAGGSPSFFDVQMDVKQASGLAKEGWMPPLTSPPKVS